MDLTQASSLIERHVAQAEAILALRDILAVAKNTDRLSREADIVLKRKQESIAQADKRIAELAKSEAAAKDRAEKIVRDAIQQATKDAKDAKARLEADLSRLRADVLKATSERSALVAEIASLNAEVTIKRKRKANGL